MEHGTLRVQGVNMDSSQKEAIEKAKKLLGEVRQLVMDHNLRTDNPFAVEFQNLLECWADIGEEIRDRAWSSSSVWC